MSTRRPQAADSLELLLDTLCNTFGGVLFIAMLVVVLLQMAGNGNLSSPEQVHSEDVLELATELEVIARELATLAKTNTPDSTPSTELPVAAGGDAQARTSESLKKLEQLRRRIDAKLVETGRLDAGAVMHEEEADDLKRRLAQEDREADELRKLIDAARKANARSIDTPVMRRTTKKSLALEIRYNRLYVIHRYNALGERIGPNVDEYAILSDQVDFTEITADPTRGLRIEVGPAMEQALRTRLGPFPADAWHLDLAVRSDSFASFHKLKTAARAAGYEMRLVLVPDNGIFSDRGGTNRGVQ